MGNRLDWISQEIEGLKSDGLYNQIRTLSSRRRLADCRWQAGIKLLFE